MDILDNLKDEVGQMIEDKVQDLRDEVKGKLDDIFDDELQKEIVDALNKNINVPFINESMEEKGLNFMYDVLEEKVKDALKKAL
tara:strand:+ start:7921 stop:8172 length:252 start_codon:yes stop_codon:yes gene_type:complete